MNMWCLLKKNGNKLYSFSQWTIYSWIFHEKNEIIKILNVVLFHVPQKLFLSFFVAPSKLQRLCSGEHIGHESFIRRKVQLSSYRFHFMFYLFEFCYLDVRLCIWRFYWSLLCLISYIGFHLHYLLQSFGNWNKDLWNIKLVIETADVA